MRLGRRVTNSTIPYVPRHVARPEVALGPRRSRTVDTSTGLALLPAGPDPVGIRTGIILNTSDIDAAHESMKELGIDVDAGIARIGSPVTARIGAVEQAEPQPPMFWFRDPDGNQLLLVEPHLE